MRVLRARTAYVYACAYAVHACTVHVQCMHARTPPRRLPSPSCRYRHWFRPPRHTCHRRSCVPCPSVACPPPLPPPTPSSHLVRVRVRARARVRVGARVRARVRARARVCRRLTQSRCLLTQPPELRLTAQGQIGHGLPRRRAAHRANPRAARRARRAHRARHPPLRRLSPDQGL
jgi:hypothetical protein